ncbi:glycosyltransferase family 2 protein [Mycoplasmoides pirum]|uniref:glycosyltransferase family 2 protein n=1 Tax=Mycoplasmoides pirum TaxID=2122 RepID=UPI00056CACCC|nr:glycosyltransferase family 2 protein [Mycoplasmoides pirum]
MYKFTIIIPTYNNAFYLKNAIESINNQTFAHENIQVLIVDDESIDNTKQVVDEWKNKTKLNIEYFYKKNNNWGSVINFVKSQNLAKGEYITVLDADDTYLPNALECVNNLNKNYDLVIGDFYKKGNKIKFYVPTYSVFVKETKNKIQAQTPFCIPLGKFLNNKLFYQLPELKEKISYQDAIYTANAIYLAESIYHIKKPMGIYNYKRIGNSMTKPWDNQRYRTEIEICLNLLKLDAQEIVAIHIMRNKFRKLLNQSMFSFKTNRKFKFKSLPMSYRWIMWIIFKLFLKKYFRQN